MTRIFKLWKQLRFTLPVCKPLLVQRVQETLGFRVSKPSPQTSLPLLLFSDLTPNHSLRDLLRLHIVSFRTQYFEGEVFSAVCLASTGDKSPLDYGWQPSTSQAQSCQVTKPDLSFSLFLFNDLKEQSQVTQSAL